MVKQRSFQREIMNNKRILFLRTSLGYGGADRVTLNLLKGYNRSEFHCDLALMMAKGEFIDEIPSDVKVYDLGVKRIFTLWIPLIKVLKSSEYDVIFSTAGGTGIPLVIASFFARYKGKIVVSERNTLRPSSKNRLKAWTLFRLKKWLYLNVDFVTAVSDSIAKEIKDYLKIEETKIRVVNNPIVNGQIAIQSSDNTFDPFWGRETPMILAVGRLVGQKDYPTLVTAFEKVLFEVPTAKLFILGKGPLHKEIESFIQSKGLEHKVKLGGFDKNPFKYMKSCAVFVLSSKHEGMPGVLIQAMSLGAACVSTDCPTGPNELIEDGKNGYLVPVGDEVAMAQRIVSLLSYPQQRSVLGANAIRSVQRFHEKEAIESYFQFLK